MQLDFQRGFGAGAIQLTIPRPTILTNEPINEPLDKKKDKTQ